MRPLVPILSLFVALSSAGAAEHPSDSLYQVQAKLEDQGGAVGGFDRYAGKPTLVSMFYASCPHVCPMLIASIGTLERELDPVARTRLRVLMVSVDPGDAPERLVAVAERHRLDLERWTLARTSADEVRTIAAALNVRYRKLPDGEYSHSTVLMLLDAAGRPLARTEQVMDPPPEFRAALRAAVAP